MRLIHEKFESYKHMINGAKINLDLNKWVLIIPDPDQPYFRVVVEATSLEKPKPWPMNTRKLLNGFLRLSSLNNIMVMRNKKSRDHHGSFFITQLDKN